MHLLITGGTGFIGSSLVQALLSEDHRVTILSRQPLADRPNCHYLKALDAITVSTHFDAVINLAGESLANKRWTTHYKRTICDSRLNTSAELMQLLQRLQVKPAVLLNASAVGYYGHHGDSLLSEDGPTVVGFAQNLCQRWEVLTDKAKSCGIRVCLLRFGVVLDRGGGAMVQMRRPFQFGVANWMGDGRQWLSWVHRQDVIRTILFLLAREDLSGPFNVTAPNPVTSRGFCAAMKQQQRTFITLPMPAPVMRLLLGEMADELLLNGQRVIPTALQNAGFTFAFSRLEAALEDILQN